MAAAPATLDVRTTTSVRPGRMLRRVPSAHSPRLSADTAAAPDPPGVLYTPEPGAFDEAIEPGGTPRPHYAGLLEALAETDLSALAEDVHADVCRHGVEFGGREVPSPFGSTWSRGDHSRGVGRARAWPRPAGPCARPLRRRRVRQAGDRRGGGAAGPGARELRPLRAETGRPAGAPVRVAIAGLDLVRDPSGRFYVLEDNLRTPSGTAYALAARETLDRHLPAGLADGRVALDDLLDTLEETLRAAAPEGVDDPTVVVLSDGPENSAWYEHERIAEALSIPLVTLSDLSVSGDRLIARVNGLRVPVDVVYRRTDEDRLEDERGKLTHVGAVLFAPIRAGTLSCVNAFGSGVGGRQADARLRREDGALLPRRGAAARLGAHLRRGRAGRAELGARPHRGARHQTAGRVRRRGRRRGSARGDRRTSEISPPSCRRTRAATWLRRRSCSRATQPPRAAGSSRGTSTSGRSSC